MTTAPHVTPDLTGKVAVVTGASRGIGATAARAFARVGAIVVLAARDEGRLAAVEREIVAAGGRALAVPTDVSDPAAVERLVARTIDAYGRLDAAFNNAGGGHMPTPLADIAVADFDQAQRVNLRGVFLCMRHEIRAMLRTGSGTIVNMSSTAGQAGAPGLASYVAAKHGVIGLTKSAALDYAPRNIRINAVAPGPILNERIEQVGEEQRRLIARAIPLGRIGVPEEVAAAVVWLCSDQAAFITGAVLPIDGGRLAGGA